MCRTTNFSIISPEAASKVSLPGLPLPDASLCRNAKKSPPRRLKIWEMRESVECSVIGTCLTDKDLRSIVARLGLTIPAATTDYQLHGYFVGRIGTESKLARAVQRVLDRRHAGMIRLVGQTEDEKALEDLWSREFGAGRVSGAYWALLTHSHVPDALLSRAFGEVHMVSHVMGRTVHATAAQVSELQAQVEDLRGRLTRETTRHDEALEKRDAEIRRLNDELRRARSDTPALSLQPPASTERSATCSPTFSKAQRALSAARERSRRAEARVETLNREIQELSARLACARSAPNATQQNERSPVGECPGAAACRLALSPGEKLRVLYIGGRTGGTPHIRSIAERASVELVHHDGGLEETVGRLGALVSRCHVVFCPVDCVSHSACLKAKGACRRLSKPFVPLKSAGQQTFARALQGIEISRVA